jgi:hypothetical protein
LDLGRGDDKAPHLHHCDNFPAELPQLAATRRVCGKIKQA